MFKGRHLIVRRYLVYNAAGVILKRSRLRDWFCGNPDCGDKCDRPFNYERAAAVIGC